MRWIRHASGLFGGWAECVQVLVEVERSWTLELVGTGLRQGGVVLE